MAEIKEVKTEKSTLPRGERQVKPVRAYVRCKNGQENNKL